MRYFIFLILQSDICIMSFFFGGKYEVNIFFGNIVTWR